MSSVLGRCSGIIPRLNYGWLERKGPRWLDRIKQRLLYKSSKRLRPLKSNLSLRPFRPSPQVFTVDQVCSVKYFYFSLGSTLSSVVSSVKKPKNVLNAEHTLRNYSSTIISTNTRSTTGSAVEGMFINASHLSSDKVFKV